MNAKLTGPFFPARKSDIVTCISDLFFGDLNEIG